VAALGAYRAATGDRRKGDEAADTGPAPPDGSGATDAGTVEVTSGG
jgi:hypothetical protein